MVEGYLMLCTNDFEIGPQNNQGTNQVLLDSFASSAYDGVVWLATAAPQPQVTALNTHGKDLWPYLEINTMMTNSAHLFDFNDVYGSRTALMNLLAQWCGTAKDAGFMGIVIDPELYLKSQPGAAWNPAQLGLSENEWESALYGLGAQSADVINSAFPSCVIWMLFTSIWRSPNGAYFEAPFTQGLLARLKDIDSAVVVIDGGETDFNYYIPSIPVAQSLVRSTGTHLATYLSDYPNLRAGVPFFVWDQYGNLSTDVKNVYSSIASNYGTTVKISTIQELFLIYAAFRDYSPYVWTWNMQALTNYQPFADPSNAKRRPFDAFFNHAKYRDRIAGQLNIPEIYDVQAALVDFDTQGSQGLFVRADELVN